MKVYVVTMRRWGDNETHNYVLGVYSSFELASLAGTTENNYRGGKYDPAIEAVVLDEDAK